MKLNSCSDIRKYFIGELEDECFTIDRFGQKTIELMPASFIADDEAIFGTPNKQYIEEEILWYESKSTNIADIKGTIADAPQAWQMTANIHGEINSNYGQLVFSSKYHNQFNRALTELIHNPDSRRAQMVYNRPSIWVEYDEYGKNDFICTNAQTFYIRDGRLDMIVQMRSNDVWAGYRNDRAWAEYLQLKMLKELQNRMIDVEQGFIFWQVMNLHVYSRNFWMVDAYGKHGRNMTKKEYTELNPDSKYL
ncbi:MAG: thymidylate synthase [Candidatus Thiodiazotropha taylori]|uniref:Thymidylate synthase n=1 Tax=Candidatus Thiodiazotropha taylori TaxID=2792791 RepID=A0A9E4K9L8_9GAMM|nr:thymidylate synthase [Candidatus Thiodiazotropha taylori]MCW4255087.1 thymidylate synthase [Candidatus Thiodiazotropha taylori]